MSDNELIPNANDRDIKAEIDWRSEQIQYAIEKAASMEGVSWRDLMPSDFLNRPIVVNLGDNYTQTISGGDVQANQGSMGTTTKSTNHNEPR